MGSWLFGNNSSANDPTPAATALRIQTSMQGRPITVLWGTQRVAGNLIWQGGFFSEQVVVGSVGSDDWLGHIFGKATPIFQTFYFVSCMFALCAGTINADATSTLRVWNGTTASTISVLGFTVEDGEFSQDVWAYLTANFPAAAFNYRGTALAVQASFGLGTSPDMPVLNWELQSEVADYGPTGQDANAADVVLDLLSNPSYGISFPFFRMDQELNDLFAYSWATGMVVSPIITDQVSAQSFLSDLFEALNSSPRWSNGVLSVVPWGDQQIVAGTITTITDGDYTIPPTDATLTFYPSIQVGTGSFVADLGVKYAIGGVPFVSVPVGTLPLVGQYSVSVNGLYTFNPTDATIEILISFQQAADASYTPDITPIYDLDENHFQPNQGTIGTGISSNDEPITWVVKNQSDLLNVIKYEYLDRSNNYDPVAIDFKDEASIVTYGKRPSDLKTRHMFALPDAAQQSAALQCIREQINANGQITLGPEFILLDVEDIVTLTREQMGFARQPVRSVEIQENDDGTLTLTLEVFNGTAAAPLFGAQESNGTSLNLLADPGPTNNVTIFTPPDSLSSPPPSNVAIYAAVSGSNPNYGGSNVYYSTDGINFSAVGVAPKAIQGLLSALLPDHASPDTVNTMSVDLTASLGALQANTHANADLSIPPCLVGNELVAYGDEVLTSANNYDCTYLTRGNYTTSHQAHPAGTSFTLIDSNVFKMFVPSSLVGATVYFKFQPFNIFQGGVADLSGLPVYPYVVGSPVPDAVQISAVMAANGTLSANGGAQRNVITLAAIGTLLANATQRLVASTILAGSGALSARTAQKQLASAALSGNGAMSAVFFAATTLDTGSLTNATLSGGNLTASHTNSTAGGARSAAQKNSGKYYMEASLTTVNGLVSTLIVLTAAGAYNDFISGPTNGAGPFTSSGAIWSGGSNSGKSLGALSSGDLLGMAVDFGAELIWFRKGAAGNWNGDPTADPATGTGGVSISAYSATTLSPAVTFSGNASEVITANFGASAFTGAVPSGFTAGWPA